MNKKYIFRRKEDGYIIIYDGKNPKEQIQADYLMKRPGFELISSVETEKQEPRLIKEVPVIEDELECPLCGEVMKNDNALIKHKEKHYGKKKS